MTAETHTLTRTGDAALEFTGKLVAQASGLDRIKDHGRHYVVSLYETPSGKLVAHVEFHTRWEGEKDWAMACYVEKGDLAGIRDKLRAVPVPPPGIGFPPLPQYAERQGRLTDLLRVQYDRLVSEVLAEADITERLD